jgi:glycosyltransferase involved in cell wall biosynthesis
VEVLRGPHIKSLNRYLTEEGETFDYVLVSRRDTAVLHFNSIERHCTNAKIVYDTCDLHFLREGRQVALGNSAARQRDLDTMKALELEFVARSDITLVVSPEEQDVLHRILPQHDVRILSNIVEPRPTPRTFAERSGMIFIGYFQHTPNVDGVLWFAREVLPELACHGLAPPFHVVGSHPPREVLKLESEQIKIHGYVPDVEPLFDQCLLSVAPLRYGAGVKGKINQSLALGGPCVTTSVGAEGIFIENGVSGMVADEASDFASAIAAVYQSEELWSKLREAGLRNTEKYFSPAVAQAMLAELVFQASRRS